jgi:nucleoside-diphosphate-sugar epimerase
MNTIVQEDIQGIIISECVDWSQFSNKTVLITGATGMLPSYMVFTLLELNRCRHLNIHVIALARNQEKVERMFKDYLEDDCLSIIVQDVSQPFTYSEHCDFVIHAASQASPKFYGTDPVGTLNANVLGTHYLLEFSIKHQVESFLFFSTGGVYGVVPESEIPMKESVCGYLDCRAVRNCYFESKRMGENMCVSYAAQYGLNAKSVRVFHTYGPTMNVHDGRAFSDFCKAVSEGRDIVLHSEGLARRTFCYITDAVKAYFIVLLQGQKGTSYNVGNSKEELSIIELATMLTRLYPEQHLRVVKEIDVTSMTYGKMKSPVQRTVPDTTLVESLGWTPGVSASEGFKRTIDCLRASQYGQQQRTI